MTPLLRKDAAWLLGFLLVGIVLQLLMLLDVDAAWMRLDDQFVDRTTAFAWVGATVLGLVASWLEELTRTREYLLHRGLSHARIFWTRQLGAAAVMLGWITLVPAIHLAVSYLVRADADLIDAGRIVTFIDSGTVAFVFYGTGLFAGSLARRARWAVPLGALLSSFILCLIFLRGGSSAWLSAVPMTIWSLLLTSALLVGALANEREGREADLPWAPRRIRSAGVVLLLVLVPGASFALHVAQKVAYQELLVTYPHMGRDDEGGLLLWGERSSRRVPHEILAADHSWGRTLPGSFVHRVFDPFVHAPGNRAMATDAFSGGKLWRGHRYQGRHCGPGPLHCYASDAGFVHVIRLAEGEDDAWSRPGHFRLGLGQGAFPADARPLGIWDDGWALVAQKSTGQLWAASLTSETPRFEPLALPGGDTYVDDLTTAVNTASIRRTPERPSFQRVVIEGERGTYTFDDGIVKTASPAVVAIAKSLRGRHELRAHATPTGALSFIGEARDAAGGVVLRHHYQPRNGREKLLAVPVIAGSLLRPPLFVGATRIFAVEPFRSPRLAWFFDPLAPFAGAGLLLANLVIGAALTGWHLRRTRSFAMAPGRRWGWALVIVAGGLVAYIAARLIETRRAWQSLPAASAPQPTPGLLIAGA